MKEDSLSSVWSGTASENSPPSQQSDGLKNNVEGRLMTEIFNVRLSAETISSSAGVPGWVSTKVPSAPRPNLRDRSDKQPLFRENSTRDCAFLPHPAIS